MIENLMKHCSSTFTFNMKLTQSFTQLVSHTPLLFSIIEAPQQLPEFTNLRPSQTMKIRTCSKTMAAMIIATVKGTMSLVGPM